MTWMCTAGSWGFLSSIPVLICSLWTNQLSLASLEQHGAAWMPLRIDLNRKSAFQQARKFSHTKSTPARRFFFSYFFFLFCLLYLFLFLHCTILLHLHIKHLFPLMDLGMQTKAVCLVWNCLNIFGGNYLLFSVALKGQSTWESKPGSALVHVS